MDPRQQRIARQGFAVLLPVLVISGCGTVYITAEHVPQSALTQSLPKQGIYYTLPKTEINVSIPVTVDITRPGAFGYDFDACAQVCRNNRNVPKLPDVCTGQQKVKVVLNRPEITLKSVPDYDHLYVVKVDAGAFDTIRHVVTLSESGVLSDATSKASSVGYEVALGVVNQVAKGAGVLLASQPKFTKHMDEQPCSDVLNIADELSALGKQIAALESRREALFPQAGGKAPMDANLAKLANEHFIARIKELKDKAVEIKSEAKLAPGTMSYKSRLVSKPMMPAAFTGFSEQLEFTDGPILDDGTVTPVSIRDFVTKDKKLSFHFALQPKPGVTVAGGFDMQTESGYRYRIPVMGSATLKCLSAGTEEHCRLLGTVLFEGDIPVAQYGPVARLPSEFRGKGGDVQLSIHDRTGGIKKAEVGAEGIPASAVVGSVDALRAALEERRKASDKEAQDAIEAEKNSLTRERDLLKLQKEIRDLKKELAGN